MATVTGWQIAEALAAYDKVVQPGTAPNLRLRMMGLHAALEAGIAAGVPTVERHILGGDTVQMAVPNLAEPVPESPIVSRCHAQRQGDEMACGRCGLRWSAGDEDPPRCSPTERRASIRREGDR